MTPYGPDTAIESNGTLGSANIVTISEFLQQILQLVLRDLAGSAFEVTKVSQAPVGGETDSGGVEIDRVGDSEGWERVGSAGHELSSE